MLFTKATVLIDELQLPQIMNLMRINDLKFEEALKMALNTGLLILNSVNSDSE